MGLGPFAAAEERLDRLRAQVCLRQKADGGARGDQLGELLLGVGGDENHGPGKRPVLGGVEALSNGQAILGTEVDVDQREIRTLLTSDSDRFLAAGRDGQDVNPLFLQHLTGGLRESRAVVDYEAPYRHESERYEREPAIGLGLATVFDVWPNRRSGRHHR